MEGTDTNSGGEKPIREIQAKLGTIAQFAELSAELVSVIELHSRKIIYTNDNCLSVLGIPADKWIKTSFEDRNRMIHPEDHSSINSFYSSFATATDTNEVKSVMFRAKNSVGEWITLVEKASIFERNSKGEAISVLSVTQNAGPQKKSEREVLQLEDNIAQRSSEKYYSLFNSIDEGFCLIQMLYDKEGKPVDWIYLEANPTFERLVGILPVGKKVSEVVNRVEPFWFRFYDGVLQTRKPARTENYVSATGRWYKIYASPVGNSKDLLAVIFDNITERKHQELQQNFLLKFSDTLRMESGADVVAKRAIQMLIDQLQLDRCYITSYYLEEDRAKLDYQIGNDTVPPLPDQFVLSDYPEALKNTFEGTLVIEDELKRQGLSESERHNSGKLGIRAMIGATLRRANRPLWSMVAISSCPRQWTEVEIKLVEEIAERTWEAIERAKAEKALRESEIQLKQLNENLERLVERRTLEVIELKLKQEKEKLNAVIFAQEQERTRIGEGLHNGVAQLMYAVQNRLQLVQSKKGNGEENLKDAIHILVEAIADARKISFQLMPPVLKDFGLSTALETLVKRIFNSDTKINLDINLKRRLQEDLEISIYRIIQEAMNNIIKHADASEASLRIHDSESEIRIRVTDNGKGFSRKDVEKQRKGIGLHTIENRIRLMDGEIKFKSSNGKGTVIDINIPL